MAEHIINRVFVFAAIFFIGFTLLDLPLGMNAQITLFLIGAMIIGLPHGALDYDVAKFLGLCPTIAKILLFFGAYLTIAGLNFVVWVYYPLAGFLVFLLLSAWHFGEDWRVFEIPHIRTLIFGSVFLSLPSFLYLSEIFEIFSFLVPLETAKAIAVILHLMAFPVFMLATAILVFDVFQKRYSHAFLGAVYLLSALILPPILFLFVYFCFLHGPQHTRELYQILNYSSLTHMMKRMLPIMGLTVVMLLGVFAFYKDILTLNAALFSSMIILIACLTTPHMLLIEYLKYKQKCAS